MPTNCQSVIFHSEAPGTSCNISLGYKSDIYDYMCTYVKPLSMGKLKGISAHIRLFLTCTNKVMDNIHLSIHLDRWMDG